MIVTDQPKLVNLLLLFLRDYLLLEAGFLAILVAPLLRRSSSTHDALTFWLVRWLLFRLVFSTGVSKLASKDPSWWDLTGRCFKLQLCCINC